MILLDTNVVSEIIRPQPSPAVLQWMSNQQGLELFIPSITKAEILYGVEILAKGKRRKLLESMLAGMFDVDFSGRILPFDAACAAVFAEIAGERKRLGRPISVFDAQIASIARVHRAKLATRNVADFEHCRLSIINPWL
jgi:predicted nucleic acid-binding protein